MKIFRILTIMLAIIMVGLLAGCGGDKTARPAEQKGAKEIKIGSVITTSGGAASLGKPVLDGIQYTVNKLNAAGGININGEKYVIKLIQYDDKGAPDSTVTAVQRLIQDDKVALIIGPITSSGTLAAMEITEKAKVPLITPTAASPAITQKGYKYIFRSVITGSEQVEAVTEYVTKELKLKKGAMLARNDDWGRSSADEFKKRLAAKGGEVVSVEFFEGTDKDFTAPLSKIKAANPDFIEGVFLGEDGTPIVKQYRELGIKAPLFGTESVDAVMAKIVGKDIVGIYAYNGVGPETPETKAFNEDFEKTMNKKAAIFNYYGADTMGLAAKSIEKAGTATDTEKIRGALLQTEYKGVKGTYKFAEDGQVKLSVWITKIVDEAGKREFIWHN